MIGSTWKKWDLHFHTPTSYDYKDKSTTNEEIINNLVAKEIKVVAITDHHVIDVDRIKKLQELGNGKITILPGIEFRAELGGSESIHFIGVFSEKCDLEDVWIKLQTLCGLSKKDISDKGGDAKIYCDLKDTCKNIHSLGGLVTVHAGGKSNSLESIKNNQEFKKALKADLVSSSIDIFELGKEEDQADYNSIVFPAINMRLPMIICSDNHDVKNYSAKQNLWIKADATFEGLKQIIFEPQHRIHIGEFPPISPPIRIDKVTLNFPDDSVFEGSPFCMAGKKEIEFSPNFTCLIGGRGTGKSTLLNLIHEKLKPGSNKFFKSKKIKDSINKPLLIQENVSIDNDTDEKYIEFLSQNEIEEFAQDNVKLTDAIYSRILKKNEDGSIITNEAALKESLDHFQHYIGQKQNIHYLKFEAEQKQKELETNKKIVESFTSPEYIALSDQLKAISSRANSILSSEEKYFSFTKDLSVLISGYKQDSSTDLYTEEMQKIITGVEQLLKGSQSVDFTPVKNEVIDLASAIKAKKDELRQYLSNKGLTEENLQGISAANNRITILESDVQKKMNEIAQTQKKIGEFNKATAEKASGDYKSELIKQIESVSLFLEKLDNKMVKPSIWQK